MIVLFCSLAMRRTISVWSLLCPTVHTMIGLYVDGMASNRGLVESSANWLKSLARFSNPELSTIAPTAYLTTQSIVRSRLPAKLHLKTYPALERYGLIWTCLRAKGSETSPEIPEMLHWDEAGFQQITCPSLDIAGFAGRQLEGFLDVAHFGFVHAETFGDPDNTIVPPYELKPITHGFEVEYRSSVGNYPIGLSDRGRVGYEWLRHFKVHLPFTATLEIHFPEGGLLCIMNAASPESAKVTRLFAPIARNYDTDLPVQDVYDFNRRIFEEDKRIVESQKPECLPLDPRMEAHISADRSSIGYRRGLRDLGLSRFFIA